MHAFGLSKNLELCPPIELLSQTEANALPTLIESGGQKPTLDSTLVDVRRVVLNAKKTSIASPFIRIIIVYEMCDVVNLVCLLENPFLDELCNTPVNQAIKLSSFQYRQMVVFAKEII
jgi:hypothetical protein